jgi:multidrug resistance efflux pump
MKIAARLLMTLLLTAVAAFGAKWLWEYTVLSPWTRDGRIDADVVALAPDVAGYISDVRVRDDQFVHKGDVVFTIDDERYKLALLG